MHENTPFYNPDAPPFNAEHDAILNEASKIYEVATSHGFNNGMEESIGVYEFASTYFDDLLAGGKRPLVVGSEDFHLKAAELKEEIAYYYASSGKYTKEQSLIAYDGAIFHFDEAARIILDSESPISTHDAMLGRISLKQANLANEFGFGQKSENYEQKYSASQLYDVEESAYLHGQRPESV
jgi:hypothetical protein